MLAVCANRSRSGRFKSEICIVSKYQQLYSFVFASSTVRPPVIPRFVSGREASISNDAQAQHSGAQQPALGDSAGAAALQLGGQQLLNRQIAQLAFLEGAEHVAAGAGGDAGEGTGGGRALRLSASAIVRARTEN